MSTILVIDSSRTVRRMVEIALAGLGVELISVATPAALTAVKADLVICASEGSWGGLPELRDALRARGLVAPIALLTRRSEPLPALSALGGDVVGALQKPFLTQRLVEVVCDALGRLTPDAELFSAARVIPLKRGGGLGGQAHSEPLGAPSAPRAPAPKSTEALTSMPERSAPEPLKTIMGSPLSMETAQPSALPPAPPALKQSEAEGPVEARTMIGMSAFTSYGAHLDPLAVGSTGEIEAMVGRDPYEADEPPALPPEAPSPLRTNYGYQVPQSLRDLPIVDAAPALAGSWASGPVAGEPVAGEPVAGEPVAGEPVADESAFDARTSFGFAPASPSQWGAASDLPPPLDLPPPIDLPPLEPEDDLDADADDPTNDSADDSMRDDPFSGVHTYEASQPAAPLTPLDLSAAAQSSSPLLNEVVERALTLALRGLEARGLTSALTPEVIEAFTGVAWEVLPSIAEAVVREVVTRELEWADAEGEQR